MQLGTIIKGISGFYYVKLDSDEEIIECKARGKFRFNELTPMVGDRVELNVKNGKGIIEKICDRSSELFRPPVANVTQAFVVFTFRNPDLNLDLLNRFLLLCEYNNIDVVVCFNKMDLLDMNEIEPISQMIKSAGYQVLFLKAIQGEGIQEIEDRLKNNVSVFCGPSGVGKSTILNKVTKQDVMKTGDISEKLGRGKHTTRHCELIESNNGLVVDTPGFSSLEIDFIKKEDLQQYFPEFDDFIGTCRFTGCIHHKEPGCSIKEAVESGQINLERYNFYIKTLEELANGRNKR